MKLNYIVPNYSARQVVQQFGEAKLIRHTNGKYELIGGKATDVVAAREWVSLFAHDIVFSRAFHRTPSVE
jgi:hypothetical protein